MNGGIRQYMKSNEKFGYGFYFKWIDQACKKSMDDILVEYDLTKSQEEILRFLHYHENESIIQKDIENFFHISNPTVTGLLNRLEAKGFITRETSEDDKRVRTIKATTKSKAMREKMKRTIQANESQLVQGFTKEEKDMLYQLLIRVADNLHKKEESND